MGLYGFFSLHLLWVLKFPSTLFYSRAFFLLKKKKSNLKLSPELITVYFDLQQLEEDKRRWITKNLPRLSAGNNGPVGNKRLEF